MLSAVTLACRRQKYDSIQLMRAVAAISVIFEHILMFNNGAFGVDLFFCISGFIMMFITEQSSAKFLERRALRIVPLYWLATVVMIVAMLVVPQHFTNAPLTLSHAIKSFLFIPYTGDHGFPLLNPGWTLTCEIFFYLVFFISLKMSHQYRHFIASGILVAVIVVSSIFQHEIPSEFVPLWGRGNSVLLEFVFGMFAYKILTRRRPDEVQAENPASMTAGHNARKASVLLLLAAVCLWVLLFILKPFPAFWDIEKVVRWGVPSALFFILIFKYFENRQVPVTMVFLGNISYSIYMVHIFIIFPFSLFVYNVNVFSPVGAVLAFVMVVPLCLLVAFLCWFLIENKLTLYLRKVLKL